MAGRGAARTLVRQGWSTGCRQFVQCCVSACQQNCSFVSGEASAIACLACLLPLCSQQARGMLILPIGLIIVTASMLRVAFGRHFFSDVVLGALLTLVVFCLLAWACEYLARGSRALSPR
ncbi:hypothetical protein ASC75_06845 [Aminobacter sp. DSM 101952]|uniref:phosphatase PAP2 family protein n=1 Tax=Aminobacter sp. DSM 101952 TaxID=2735891 RepID=UPI0006F6A3D2|nr:phosphatase PAP2 family protein [Aminobacter sp. DSM 101952]KQU69859.1 hypothetical protein ASC75_06845 [Aminobacter sp. DSM 101952]